MRRAMPVERRIEIDGVPCFTGRHAGRVHWLVLTGIGPKAADAAANAILNQQTVALAVSVGFAGGLVPAAAVGDVIVATSVLSGTFDGSWTQSEGPVACEEGVLGALQAAAAQRGMTVRSGPVVSLATVLCRAVEKETVSRLTGAVALDMESAALGKVAKVKGVPFGVVRTVSDVAGEDLPLDFNAFLKPWGWIRGLGAVMMTPSSLIGLNRLRRQSLLAAERLTAVCAGWAETGFGLSSVSHTGRA